MYKYQCSKHDCSSYWSLHEGNLNGFVLTCPICSKGRGIFVSQGKTEADKQRLSGIEEIIITVDTHAGKSVDQIKQATEEYIKKNSLILINRNIETLGNEIICKIQYKISSE